MALEDLAPDVRRVLHDRAGRRVTIRLRIVYSTKAWRFGFTKTVTSGNPCPFHRLPGGSGTKRDARSSPLEPMTQLSYFDASPVSNEDLTPINLLAEDLDH